MISVKVEEHNINDIWLLPCVKCIQKYHEKILVAVKAGKYRGFQYAHEGDWIVVDSQQSERGRVVSDDKIDKIK